MKNSLYYFSCFVGGTNVGVAIRGVWDHRSMFYIVFYATIGIALLFVAHLSGRRQ